MYGNLNKPKVVLLCGGFGTRLSEETSTIPKPMVEIGGMPILQHIMDSYIYYGLRDFVIALGYKGNVIKQYFLNYFHNNSDINIQLKNGMVEVNGCRGRDCSVSLRDTGLHTMTGGRLLRIRDELPEGTFMLAYGDCLADININKLLDYHRSHGKIATVTAVKPKERFGVMEFEEDRVVGFKEKIQDENRWINGGFFVFEKEIFGYIEGDNTSLESDVLDKVARDNQLMAYKNDSFWACMDTLNEKMALEEHWNSGMALWKPQDRSGGGLYEQNHERRYGVHKQKIRNSILT